VADPAGLLRDDAGDAGQGSELIDRGQAELSDEQRWFHGPP